jgi:RNA polymerase sigma factor (sigma-70 family)
MAGNGAISPQHERQQAFLEFVRQHEGELRGFTLHLVRSADLTQDIVQKTFLKAWCDTSFDPSHPFARAWVFTTARRLIIEWRRSEESNSISLDDLSERARRDGSRGSQSAFEVDRKTRDPLVGLIEQESKQTLDVALFMLAEDQRDVLERYYLRREGTQYEIARAMGISIAAFNSRLNRARKELKRLILKFRERERWMHNGHDF